MFPVFTGLRLNSYDLGELTFDSETYIYGYGSVYVTQSGVEGPRPLGPGPSGV